MKIDVGGVERLQTFVSRSKVWSPYGDDKTLESIWLKMYWLNDDAAHVMLVGVTEDAIYVTFVAGIGFLGICIPRYIASRKTLVTES
ncbi:MAG: hypothetical protein QM730_31045 [Anaerolineales bacterium]